MEILSRYVNIFHEMGEIAWRMWVNYLVFLKGARSGELCFFEEISIFVHSRRRVTNNFITGKKLMDKAVLPTN